MYSLVYIVYTHCDIYIVIYCISLSNIQIYIYICTYIYIYNYIFAGPWPRACQITNVLFLLQHLLRLSSNFYIPSILLPQLYVCLTTSTISVIVVGYCSDTCCLLFKNGRARGAVRKPLGSTIVASFTFWGHLFHIQFCALPFAPKSQIVVKTCATNCADNH